MRSPYLYQRKQYVSIWTLERNLPISTSFLCLIASCTALFYLSVSPSVTLRHVWMLSQISPCKFKSLPLLPQNGHWDKSQTFSFDRVQEITVYISSCITRVSKSSGFGGAGWSWRAGAYHCWLLWCHCRHWGGKRLYHLCFVQAQLFSLTGFDRLSAGAEDLWCAHAGRESMQGNHSCTSDPQTYRSSACWSSSLNYWDELLLLLFLFFITAGHPLSCVLAANENLVRFWSETFCGWP